MNECDLKVINNPIPHCHMETDMERILTKLENQDETLGKIYEQALKTNGRVNAHDNWIAGHTAECAERAAEIREVRAIATKHEAWHQRAAGIWAAVCVVGALIGAVVGIGVAVLGSR